MKSKHRPSRFKRRDFLKSCASIMALSLPRRVHSNDLKSIHRYPPTLLVDRHQEPVRAATLKTGAAYVFHFPYRATPCFLINLGLAVTPGPLLKTETGEKYQWPGGAGPNKSIVAFSAICAHKMTHPSKSVSFINYRPDKTSFTNSVRQPSEKKHVIYCCSEGSVYDARDGARVLGGPAGQPLAAIGLKHDPENDSLTAASTFGGEMFEKFFENFTFRLQLEYQVTDVGAGVGETTVVQLIDEFTKSQVLC